MQTYTEPSTEAESIRTWQAGPFRLDLFDTGETDYLGKYRLAYRLFDSRMGEEPVFEDSDFCCPPLDSIDSDATVAALLGFLSLRPGDTDPEYFADYSARQTEWMELYADELGLACLDLKED